MNTNVIESLNDIIEETVSYQNLIDGEAWDELDKKLKHRQEKLESIFTNPIADEQKDNVIDQLSKVANLDKVYQSQLERNRTQSANNVISFQKKKNAANAYRQTQEN